MSIHILARSQFARDTSLAVRSKVHVCSAIDYPTLSDWLSGAVRQRRGRARICTLWGCSPTEHVHCRFRATTGQCQDTKACNPFQVALKSGSSQNHCPPYTRYAFIPSLSANTKHVAKPKNQVMTPLKTHLPTSAPS